MRARITLADVTLSNKLVIEIAGRSGSGFQLAHRTQARLHREGRSIVADLGGLQFVPQSGQLVFGSLEGDCRKHVRMHDERGVARTLARLGKEQGQLRALRTKGAERCARSTTPVDLKIRAGGG